MPALICGRPNSRCRRSRGPRGRSNNAEYTGAASRSERPRRAHRSNDWRRAVTAPWSRPEGHLRRPPPRYNGGHAAVERPHSPCRSTGTGDASMMHLRISECVNLPRRRQTRLKVEHARGMMGAELDGRSRALGAAVCRPSSAATLTADGAAPARSSASVDTRQLGKKSHSAASVRRRRLTARQNRRLR